MDGKVNMFMPYLYLSLIPTLITILMLFFGKNFKKRYDVKKTIPVLVTLFIGELISITHEVWFMYNNPQMKMYSLKYLLSLSAFYICTPILVLYVNKVCNGKTVFENRWVRISLTILLLVLIVLPFLLFV